MEPVGNQVLRNLVRNKLEEEKEKEGTFGALCFVCLKNKANKS